MQAKTSRASRREATSLHAPLAHVNPCRHLPRQGGGGPHTGAAQDDPATTLCTHGGRQGVPRPSSQSKLDATATWLGRGVDRVHSRMARPTPLVGQTFTQAPVFLYLLELVGYPDVSNLRDDLENGFDMIGEVRRGPGWRDRDDDRYSNPITRERLRASNLAYVRRRTSHGRAAPHSDVMLRELIEETRLGRVIGPAKRTDWWPAPTTPIPDVADMDTLVEPPTGDVFAAGGREGENWRRSSHNATVRAWDVPTSWPWRPKTTVSGR